MVDRDELRTATNLELSGQYLSEEDLECITQNQVVCALELGYGDLNDAWLERICRLETLSSLSISHTAVTDAGFKHLANLHQLQSLDAGGLAITDEGVAHLHVFESFRRLVLNGTLAGDAHLEWIARLHGLEKLGVGRKTTDQGLLALSSASELSELDLSGSAITGTTLRTLSTLSDLSILHLSDLQLCNEGFEALQYLKSVWLLSLHRTPVSRAQLQSLGRLSQLENLQLSNNGITAKGQIWLAAQLSECTVVDLSELLT